MLWWLQRLDMDQHGGFLSAGLGLGHKDVDGYRGRFEVHQGSVVTTRFGRGRQIWLLWPKRP